MLDAGIARDADLVSHEATFSKQMEEKAWKSQHSTAAMAGNFARKIQARLLVLTHFSSRYSHMNQGGKPEMVSIPITDMKSAYSLLKLSLLVDHLACLET